MSFLEILVTLAYSLLASLLLSTAALVNVTVDDNAFDPRTGVSISYAPSEEWNIGPNCSSCAAQPDPMQAYNRTWHDITYRPTEDVDAMQTATFFFNGVRYLL